MTKVLVATTTLVVLVALIAPEAVARSQSKWSPSTATRWTVGGGGDDFRTGYSPSEKQPPFIKGGHIASDDSDGPWLEWVTKISDLPSGVWPEAGMVAVDGIIYVSGASTNSFLALNAKTGLPVWRFSPDQRTDGATSAYPGSNAPVVKNGVAYVTFSNGWMYALNAKTGKKIWSYQAKEGYQGKPPPGADAGRCAGGKCALGKTDFDPIHATVQYPKIHGATAFCDNKVFFMTLSGWAYGLDGKTGKLLWKRYADGPDFPGELTWWEYPVGGALAENNKSAGASTRRFEAVPGLACLNDEVQVAGSDGHLRFLNPRSGKADASRVEYDRKDSFGGTIGDVDFCQAAGWNCDIAVGLAVPPLGAAGGGDYIVTTLDGRIIRLKWDTHAPTWRRTYNAPLPLELESPLGDSFLLSLAHGEHGFLTQAVVGGPMALDPDIKGKGADPILYAPDQDGRLYVLAINRPADGSGCLRPGDGAAGPCLLSRVGMQANTDPQTPYTRRGEGGPWDFNQHALSGATLGGNVLYVTTWDNRITGFDVRNPANPKKVWQHEIKWDTTFQYPPFGDTYKTPFADIDNKIFSSPALLDGHLYFAANDGRVYAFNLMKKVKTVKNLVILGSGVVPFVPKWKDKLGAFDRVWTPADWYKNQVPPSGYRLPKPAGVFGAATLLLGAVVLLWWYARRDDFDLEVVEKEVPS
jgi:outer membrane protein assembly factor BamB